LTSGNQNSNYWGKMKNGKPVKVGSVEKGARLVGLWGKRKRILNV